jgi:hypothetical protein
MRRERRAAEELSTQIDRLYAAPPREQVEAPPAAMPELLVATRLRHLSQAMPPVPEALRHRIRDLVGARAEHAPSGAHAPPGAQPPSVRWRSAAWGALAATLVLLTLFLALPTGQHVLAQAMRILLGQTEVALTPTLPPPTRATREPLDSLLAVELAMGRAPSLPRTLPEGYVLREMAAVSYPELPEWISQPFYVELAYGLKGGAFGLWLREYRLLFREYGEIKGIAAASESVSHMEEVDVSGVPGAMMTFADEESSHTVVWERDGLLLELKTDRLSEEELLRVARSVR